MRAQSIPREGIAPEQLRGRILCNPMREEGGGIVFRKGQRLDGGDLPRLLELPWDELHLIQMDAGDLHEDEAGRRLAAAVAGEGIAVGAMSGGHWPLSATRRGILEIDTDALRRINSIDGISVYTLFHGQIIDAGEPVARAKIIPLVLSAERLDEVERVARETKGIIRIRPFLPLRVGAVVQETLGQRAMERFRDVLGEKLGWFGAELLPPRFVDSRPEALADALRATVDAGAATVILAGTRAMDPLDPAFGALDRLGIQIERHGVPAHPGSLFWLARLDEVPVLGMPSCGMFSRATVFDLLLPRVLAGERIGRMELAELGHGGFLTREMTFRFPPYRPARERGEVG